MVSKEKQVRFVSRLNSLTKEGRLEWERRKIPHPLVREDSHYPDFYVTEYQSRQVGIFKEQYKSFDIEIERPYWESVLGLVLLNESDDIIFRFQYVIGISELFDSVQVLSENVEEFIDDFLNEDDEDAE